MAFRREVLGSLGGFDPRLDLGTRTRGAGDLDMFYRVLDAGYVIRYEPRAIVRHVHRDTCAGLLSQSVDWGTAYDAYLAKHERGSKSAARDVRRHRRRRWTHRHLRRTLAAIRHRRWLELPMAFGEAYGSLRGRRALASETTRLGMDASGQGTGREASPWTTPKPLA
jgi:hypothetical protein